MSKRVVIYRVILINVVLFFINVVDSGDVAPKSTPDTLTTNNTNVDSSQPKTTRSSTLLLNDFKLLGKNDQGNLTVELESAKYDLEKFPNGSPTTYVYTLKEGVKFSEFKYRNVTVWKHLPKKNQDYPTKMRVSKSGDYLSVFLNSNSYGCVYSYTNSWKLDYMKDKCYDPSEESTETESPETVESQQFQQSPTSKTEQSQLVATFEPEQAQSELTADPEQAESEVSVQPEQAESLPATATPEQSQSEVTVQPEQTEESSVTVNVQPKLSGVTVNVTKTSGNSDYEFKSESNLNKFTPKAGKGFDTVKDGFFTKVWETKDPNLYGKFVVYKGAGTQNVSVTVLHLNNTYTVFTKQDNKWKQYLNGTCHKKNKRKPKPNVEATQSNSYD